MWTLQALFSIFFSFVLCNVKGDVVDKTAMFAGRTAHAEYLYSGFRGHWIGPYGDGSDITMAEYDGYLRAVAEENIFNPGSGVRLYFKDCNDGYVCIRSRWREDEDEKWNDPDSQYLQAAWKDVDFIRETSPSFKPQLRWRVFCESDLLQSCEFGVEYYQSGSELARLYGTNRWRLNTAYKSDHSDNWFKFRVVMPNMISMGQIRTTSTECNLGTSDVTTSVTHFVGIGFNNTSSFPPWAITSSVQEEVKSGFEAANNPDWAEALTNVETFHPESERSFTTTLRPRKKLSVVQLTGLYGPYVVHDPTNILYITESC